jgi:hypothetical protein
VERWFSVSKVIDNRPLRTLALFLAGGAFLFVLGLFTFLTLLGAIGGFSFDSSVLSFYPIITGLGALFGFGRWWSYEVGPVNPFHDS